MIPMSQWGDSMADHLFVPAEIEAALGRRYILGPQNRRWWSGSSFLGPLELRHRASTFESLNNRVGIKSDAAIKRLPKVSELLIISN